MLEQRRPANEEQFGPARGGPSGLDAGGGSHGAVTVSHGLYVEALPLGNMTVAEIRARYADQFDIDPQSQVTIDGYDAGESDRVLPGQNLIFLRPVGAKGSARIAIAKTQIMIEETTVHAVSPEGESATMPLNAWANIVGGRRFDSGDVVLANGTRVLASRGPWSVWVHETPPQVYRFKWIASDSPVPHGPATRYRNVSIALPYLVVFAIFKRDLLGKANECFFRVKPLGDDSDELFYPALLNCSKFNPQEGNPLAWICTSSLDRTGLLQHAPGGARMRAGLGALRRCLLETGFNYSSEEHEESSWFTESNQIDPRIASVEAWVAATRTDPLFVLDVPWLKTSKTVRQVINRMFANRGQPAGRDVTAGDLARPVFNYRAAKRDNA